MAPKESLSSVLIRVDFCYSETITTAMLVVLEYDRNFSELITPRFLLHGFDQEPNNGLECMTDDEVRRINRQYWEFHLRYRPFTV